MRDDGNKKGRGKKVESSTETPSAGSEGKAVSVKTAPLTAKEKIAANQKNKRRK